MTTTPTDTLVLKDQTGDYFLVAQAVLERGRVPEEHKVEVERLLAKSGDDVTGFFFHFVHPQFARALAADAALMEWLERQLRSGGKA
jgi:hypothetical protein